MFGFWFKCVLPRGFEHLEYLHKVSLFFESFGVKQCKLFHPQPLNMVDGCEKDAVDMFWKTFDGFTQWSLPSSKADDVLGCFVEACFFLHKFEALVLLCRKTDWQKM